MRARASRSVGAPQDIAATRSSAARSTSTRSARRRCAGWACRWCSATRRSAWSRCRATTRPWSYGPADQELLGFVASQIANSLNRRRAAEIQQEAYAQLEQRVQARTHELRDEIAERERIQDQLKHEVMHDALTGLPNRGYLRDRLNRVLARLEREPDRRCALLYLDIDRFKIINDSLGHLAGDEVLKEVARRLQTCVRDPDLVARLSGDEFAILLEDVDVPATAIKVAQRVLDLLGRAACRSPARCSQPSASIGIAIGDDRYVLADELLRDADTALYRAKSLGRKRFELFDDDAAEATAIDVLALEGELRDGAAAGPVRALLPADRAPGHRRGGRLRGADALEPSAPAACSARRDFLQIAEDSGSIEAIDWRMFELSCDSRPALGHAGTYLTINVAPRHLRHEDFDDAPAGGARRAPGLDADAPARPRSPKARCWTIPSARRASSAACSDAGVGAALDDFGTGYSSLSYLH